ncbi:hypothetical protein FMEXI_13857 [Fusarium mexicanum]|uniref:Uncharacterized protein n=1 Tax=Fusarium mexicanum TaxID=751941 RepID=A0A8H5MIG5_9HYPO|nr:hypothetical protein FMEXI_13857 [Fusarium mexicanum]
MSNHSQNIDNTLPLLSVHLRNIQSDNLLFPKQHLHKRGVVYYWTEDDKEEFELEPVQPKTRFGLEETALTEVDDKSFVMDASLVRNTLFLTLFKDEKPHSNETTFAPSPTTVGQHHILEYSFGGLNLVVTSPGHLIRNGSEERFARIITSDPELEKGSCPRLLSLLWFSGTHTRLKVCQEEYKGMGEFRRDEKGYEDRVSAPSVRAAGHYGPGAFQVVFNSLRGQWRSQMVRGLRCLAGTTVAYFVWGDLG